MTETIYSPVLDNLLHAAQGYPVVINADDQRVLMQIVERMQCLKICGDDERRILWLSAERGGIEQFGDYDELLEEGEVSSREDFESWWLDMYPDPVKWYRLTVRHYGSQYFFFINENLTFHINPDEPARTYDIDRSQLLAWLLEKTEGAIQWLRRDEAGYNEFIGKNLAYSRRKGRILRETYWQIVPDAKEWMLKGLTESEIETLREIVEQSESLEKPAHSEMTAGMFFECCKMGYVANDYSKGGDMPAVEMYRRFADGRHDGLLDLAPDSPDAFRQWVSKGGQGGHPWEVCRGGNSTHISLYAHLFNEGWRLILAGSSAGRVAETVRFAIALFRNNIHFELRQAREILAMVTGKDFIGIVPEGITPVYCHSWFPQEDNIIDFMNLGFECKDEIIAAAYWYPEERIELA